MVSLSNHRLTKTSPYYLRPMSQYAKWLGGGLGWVLGGPIGAILGFVLGNAVDSRKAGTSRYTGPETSPSDFTVTLLVLTAAVMKADGKVVKAELDYVKEFLKRNFGIERAKDMTLMLRDIVEKDFEALPVCRQIAQNMQHAGRLELLHLLFGIAQADGKIEAAEIRLLEEMAHAMRISAADFDSIKAMFIASTDDAYKILEITPAATDEEVKKAYRRMAAKHHPDKVATLGEDVQKAANEKFQKVNEAYEKVKGQRGMA